MLRLLYDFFTFRVSYMIEDSIWETRYGQWFSFRVDSVENELENINPKETS